MTNLYEAVEEANNITQALIESDDVTEVNYGDKDVYERMGLDPRVGTIFVGEDFIAIRGRSNSLDYYGGFEYVDAEHITKIGKYTFYSTDDSRVAEHVDRFHDRNQEENEEE